MNNRPTLLPNPWAGRVSILIAAVIFVLLAFTAHLPAGPKYEDLALFFLALGFVL